MPPVGPDGQVQEVTPVVYCPVAKTVDNQMIDSSPIVNSTQRASDKVENTPTNLKDDRPLEPANVNERSNDKNIAVSDRVLQDQNVAPIERSSNTSMSEVQVHKITDYVPEATSSQNDKVSVNNTGTLPAEPAAQKVPIDRAQDLATPSNSSNVVSNVAEVPKTEEVAVKAAESSSSRENTSPAEASPTRTNDASTSRPLAEAVAAPVEESRSSPVSEPAPQPAADHGKLVQEALVAHQQEDTNNEIPTAKKTKVKSREAKRGGELA